MILLLIIIFQQLEITHCPSFLSGGDYFQVQIVDSPAFFATGRGLEIFNIKDSIPTRISKFATEGQAVAIDIVGNRAYIADDYKGLCIVDIANPQSPKLVGYFDTEGMAKAVKVRNKYAYLADWNNGFLIIDISNVLKPKLVGRYSNIGMAFSVTLKDSLAFVGSFNKSLKIINIKNPRKPTVIGEFPVGDDVYGADICIDDTLGFINCGFIYDKKYCYFAVLNIKNPSKPELIAALPIPETNPGIIKQNNCIYTNTQKGIYILDVTNTKEPFIKNIFNDNHISGNNFKIYNNLLLVPQFLDGFAVFDISTSQEPKKISFYQNIKWQFMAHEDSINFIYIVGNIPESGIFKQSVLKIIDINDPDKPVPTCANFHFAGRGVIYEGSIDYPYLAVTQHRGHPAHETLYTAIFDVSEPCTPKIIRTVKGGGPTEMHYPFLFVLEGEKIKIADINNQNFWIDSLMIRREIYDLAMSDSLIFITGQDSLYVLNIKTRKLLSSCYHGKRYAMNISLDFPYLAIPYTPCPGSTYGFCIFDVSNPNFPRLMIDTVLYESPINPQCINIMGCELTDSLLCFGRGNYGFDIWKVKLPDSVYRIATHDTPNIATHCYPPGNSNIFIRVDHIYLMDYGSLEIYKLINH